MFPHRRLCLTPAEHDALLRRGYKLDFPLNADGPPQRATRHGVPLSLDCLPLTRSLPLNRVILRKAVSFKALPSHPHLLTILDLFLTKQPPQPYLLIFTESIDRGRLSQYLTDKRNDRCEPTVGRLYRQTLCGMVYLHEQGIPHGAVSSENVCLSSAGAQLVAKVAYFDTANTQHHLVPGDLGLEPEMVLALAGRVSYMPPEVLRFYWAIEDGAKEESSKPAGANQQTTPSEGLPYDAFKADVWSMGVLLYVTLQEGELPFPHPEGEDYVDKIKLLYEGLLKNQRKAMKITVSKEATVLMERMLKVSANYRPTLAHALEDVWFKKF